MPYSGHNQRVIEQKATSSTPALKDSFFHDGVQDAAQSFLVEIAALSLSEALDLSD